MGWPESLCACKFVCKFVCMLVLCSMLFSSLFCIHLFSCRLRLLGMHWVLRVEQCEVNAILGCRFFE